MIDGFLSWFSVIQHELLVDCIPLIINGWQDAFAQISVNNFLFINMLSNSLIKKVYATSSV